MNSTVVAFFTVCLHAVLAVVKQRNDGKNNPHVGTYTVTDDNNRSLITLRTTARVFSFN